MHLAEMQSAILQPQMIVKKRHSLGWDLLSLPKRGINHLSNESKSLIQAYPPNLIFIYSSRSAESFIEIVKNYSLYPLMTESKVMCISKKVKKVFELEGWKKIEIFNPGDEILKLEQ